MPNSTVAMAAVVAATFAGFVAVGAGFAAIVFAVLDDVMAFTDFAISHQLRTLRAARLVSYRKAGRQVFYRLHDHHVVALYQTVQEHLAE